MGKKQRIKERAKVRKEAEHINKAAAKKKAETAKDLLNHAAIDIAPASEHRQLLTKASPLQDAPGSKPEYTGKKRGAKSLCTLDACLQAEKLAAQGCTNEEIAKALGIGIRTLYDWCNQFPHFSHALDKYRGHADMLVENALFRSALGYDYTEEQVAKDGFAVEIRKHVTGSVAAQKYYLNNRMPDRYKNKVETVLSLGADISQVGIAIKRRED